MKKITSDLLSFVFIFSSFQVLANDSNLKLFTAIDHCPACEKNVTIYYDESKISISKDKRFVTIPFVTDYVSPQNWIDGGTYLSIYDKNIYDCQKMQFKSLIEIFYSDLDGSGKVISTIKTNDREEWMPLEMVVTPAYVRMFNFSCSFAK